MYISFITNKNTKYKMYDILIKKMYLSITLIYAITNVNQICTYIFCLCGNMMLIVQESVINYTVFKCYAFKIRKTVQYLAYLEKKISSCSFLIFKIDIYIIIKYQKPSGSIFMANSNTLLLSLIKTN